MRRFVDCLVVGLLFAPSGCFGVGSGGHPLKDSGLCESRGGDCHCEDPQGPGFPQLDCGQPPFSCHMVCWGAVAAETPEPDAGPPDSRTPRLIVGTSGSGQSTL